MNYLNHPEIDVVAGIIKREGKILVGKRPDGKILGGYWEFPGGKIEKGESSKAALRRELQEELDIEMAEATFWFKHTYSYPDKIVHLEIWFIESFSGEPKGKEGQMLKWVTNKTLKKLNFLAGNAYVIEQLQQA